MSSLAAIAMRSARPALRSNVQAQTIARRNIHPGPNWHFPFNFTTTTNKALALKLGGVMTGAFLIPFAAIGWHWNRPGGLNHSKAA